MSRDREKFKLHKGPQQEQLEAAQRQRNEIAQAMAAGTVAIVDRFGNKVEAGHYVMFHLELDQVWQVTDVSPVMDIRQPPGMARVTVAATIQFMAQLSQRTMGLAVVGRMISGAAQVTGPVVPDAVADAVEAGAGVADGDEQGQDDGQGSGPTGDVAPAREAADGDADADAAADLGDKAGA